MIIGLTMLKLYGIPNCNTVKKARQWLEDRGIEYQFHNFKKEGLAAEQVDAWLDQLDWEILINRRGTTWRKLPDTERSDLDRAKARELMLTNPSLIKRPVIETGDILLVGFDPDRYETIL